MSGLLDLKKNPEDPAFLRWRYYMAMEATPEGVVYLAQCGNSDYYKIGATNGILSKRIADLQAGCPYLLNVILVIYHPHPYKPERMIHNFFVDKWIRGEWYKLTNDDINIIRRHFKEWLVDLKQSMT